MDFISLAREFQAISQTGLHFAQNTYDQERYRRVGELAAALLSGCSNVPPATILEWNAKEFGYATPKVDVRGVIFREGQILLVREDADEGRWTLPGGWADVNESPSESVIREVKEESGFDCDVKGLLAVLDREKQGHVPPFPYHVYKLFFHCEIVAGEPTPNFESSESGFFGLDTLPELSLSRVKPAQIRRFFEQIRVGDGTTDFD